MRRAKIRVLDHLELLEEHFSVCELPGKIVAILLELGIPTNYIGFEYLKQAILLFCLNSSDVMFKGVYASLIEYYGIHITEKQIAQAMHSAIQVAWENKNKAPWIRYFSQGKGVNMKKPGNIEFISRIARFVELWHDSGKKEGSLNGKQ